MEGQLWIGTRAGDRSAQMASSRLGRMGRLEVCDDALQSLAGQHAATSARLANQVPTAVAGPPMQATSEAVSAAYAVLQSTAAVLAARVQATGSKIATSAIGYETTESGSAHRLAALDRSVRV